MTPGMPPWRRSPYDGALHLMRRETGELSEALCEHSAPTSQMEDPQDDDRRCHVCILVLGMELADRRGDPGNYVG